MLNAKRINVFAFIFIGIFILFNIVSIFNSGVLNTTTQVDASISTIYNEYYDEDDNVYLYDVYITYNYDRVYNKRYELESNQKLNIGDTIQIKIDKNSGDISTVAISGLVFFSLFATFFPMIIMFIIIVLVRKGTRNRINNTTRQNSYNNLNNKLYEDDDDPFNDFYKKDGAKRE
ncbi:MAG: hypothetical protein R3Y05_02370 [bacterium]